MTPAESENRFDELLRGKLAADELTPSAGLWPSVSETLPLPRPRTKWPLGAAGVAGLVVGGLLGGGLNTVNSDREAAPISRTAVPNVRHTIPNVRQAIPNVGTAVPNIRHTIPHVGTAIPNVGTTASYVRPTTAAAGAPIVTRWALALIQDSTIRREAARTLAPVRPDSASRLPALITAQRATLRTLQHQLDSLKAALPAEPVALAVADSGTLAAGPVDSAVRPALAPLRRWSVVLLAETTPKWGALPGPADSRETSRETIGGADAVSLQVEHRLANDRWLVRGGFGQVRLSGTFRAVDETTGQTLVSDTAIATQTDIIRNVDTTFIIPGPVLQLNPRVNAGGQIIGYDSLWTPSDTLYQVIVSHDTVRRTTSIISTRLDTWRETREQTLRPTYRFWTIPVAAQVDVLRRGRWRAGLSVGAQVLIFRGGDAPVRIGDTYVLRRIGPHEGPFRPVSVALTTGLDVRYRLTERLSLLAGAGGRGWVQNPTRGEARPRVQPTGQVGLSWGLGGR